MHLLCRVDQGDRLEWPPLHPASDTTVNGCGCGLLSTQQRCLCHWRLPPVRLLAAAGTPPPTLGSASPTAANTAEIQSCMYYITTGFNCTAAAPLAVLLLRGWAIQIGPFLVASTATPRVAFVPHSSWFMSNTPTGPFQSTASVSETCTDMGRNIYGTKQSAYGGLSRVVCLDHRIDNCNRCSHDSSHAKGGVADLFRRRQVPLRGGMTGPLQFVAPWFVWPGVVFRGAARLAAIHGVEHCRRTEYVDQQVGCRALRCLKHIKKQSGCSTHG